MNAAFSLQDCERKYPASTYQVLTVDVKTSGIDVRFSKGTDDRTHQPYVYSVKLTPGAGSGAWSSQGEEGNIERVIRTALPTCVRVEGIWIESGNRQIMVLELPL